jgi:hypothetical protein
MLLLVAILMGLTALAAGLAPPPPRERAVQPTPTVAPSVAAESPEDPVQLTMDAGEEGAQSVAANAGDLVHLTVTSDEFATVALDGYGITRPVSPESVAEFDVLAVEGSFKIELLETGRLVGTLEITGAE